MLKLKNDEINFKDNKIINLENKLRQAKEFLVLKS